MRITKFITTRWFKINGRTVNGSNPDRKSPKSKRYIEQGIEIRFSYEEFENWCLERYVIIRDLFLAGEIPSIDRIDANSHYEFSNMQIISKRENSRKATIKRNSIRTKNMEIKYPSKPCGHCNRKMSRKRNEKWVEFAQRKYCDASCGFNMRTRDKETGKFI